MFPASSSVTSHRITQHNTSLICHQRSDEQEQQMINKSLSAFQKMHEFGWEEENINSSSLRIPEKELSDCTPCDQAGDDHEALPSDAGGGPGPGAGPRQVSPPRRDRAVPVQNQGSLHTSQVSNLLPSFPDILSLITIKDTNSPHKYPFHSSERAGSRANDIYLNVLTLLFLKRFPVPIVTKHLLSASLGLGLERACPWLHPVCSVPASPHWWGPWRHCSQISRLSCALLNYLREYSLSWIFISWGSTLQALEGVLLLCL